LTVLLKFNLSEVYKGDSIAGRKFTNVFLKSGEAPKRVEEIKVLCLGLNYSLSCLTLFFSMGNSLSNVF